MFTLVGDVPLIDSAEALPFNVKSAYFVIE